MRAEHFEDLYVDPERMNGPQIVAHLARRLDETLLARTLTQVTVR